MSTKLSRFISIPCLGALALACLALTGCGDKEAKGAATQVAAKVGSEEISVHQINQAMARVNTAGATPEVVAAMSREVLEKLIDQQLSINQATEDKLQRSPDVVARIEAARREILAQAFVQEVTAQLPKPTPEEIKQYYTSHPELFSDRHVYSLLEITAENIPGTVDLLRSYATNGKPVDALVAELRDKKIRFTGGPGNRTAEQVPLELLPRLQAQKDGQAIVTESPNAVIYTRVVGRQSQPVDEASAQGKIAQFLMNQRVNQALSDRLKKLRADTTVTYMGEFVKPAPSANAAGSAAQPSPAPTAPTAAQAPSADASAANARSTLEKGIAGLK